MSDPNHMYETRPNRRYLYSLSMAPRRRADVRWQQDREDNPTGRRAYNANA